MIPPKISMQVFIIIIAIFFFQVNNFAEIGGKFSKYYRQTDENIV